MAQSSGQFRFRKHDTIGANAAEDDAAFLQQCYVDTGEVRPLLDCKLPQRIVLGRPGSGKTALLEELERSAEHVIAIEPEHLSLNYVANSTILQYLSGLGINLDPFFKLLWRHVFAVTFIQERFSIATEEDKQSFFAWLTTSREETKRKQVEDERRKKAISYIERWGTAFWMNAEYRVKEVVSRFESEVTKGLTSTLEGGLDGSSLFGAAPTIKAERTNENATSQKASGETNAEIVQRATQIVNEIQVRELSGMIELIDEILDDPQKPRYIVIDRLDEAWVDESLRYRLIKALLDALREFRKVRHGKIIVCLRIDLLERVFRESRGEPGFQEDKYHSLYLHLSWTDEQLSELINRRLAMLVKDSFTSYQPTVDDLLPASLTRKTSQKPIDYIIERTWKRPRDLIDFFNICIRKAENKASFTKEIIVDAEGEYSGHRLKAIGEEWQIAFPGLLDLATALLTGRTHSFVLNEISDDEVREWAGKIVMEPRPVTGPLFKLAERHICESISHAELRRELASVLYRTSMVGLKTAPQVKARWIDNESASVSISEIDDETRVEIHPGLYRVLGIQGK